MEAMNENLLEVGDHVKIPLPKAYIDDSTDYVYGQVKDFKYGGNVVVIGLDKPYKGSLVLDTPTHDAV